MVTNRPTGAAYYPRGAARKVGSARPASQTKYGDIIDRRLRMAGAASVRRPSRSTAARSPTWRRKRALARSLLLPVMRPEHQPRREEVLMKYVLGLALGIPIPILIIWLLVSRR